jgi:hypothetical protein
LAESFNAVKFVQFCARCQKYRVCEPGCYCDRGFLLQSTGGMP